MSLLLAFIVALMPIGAITGWAGAYMLREQWILRRRGVRVPAVAERLMSRAGPFGIYRFIDTDGRTRIANADRVRRLPAVEVEIVYDPKNTTLVQERSGLVDGIIGVLCLLIGTLVTVSAIAAFAAVVVVAA